MLCLQASVARMPPHALWSTYDQPTCHYLCPGPRQVKSVPVLMAEEMIHPFFIFQYASVTIW